MAQENLNLSVLHYGKDYSVIGAESILNKSTSYSSNKTEVNQTHLQLSRERTTPNRQLKNLEGQFN
jgi:hypothetical protein